MSKKDLRDPPMMIHHLPRASIISGPHFASQVEDGFPKGVAFAEFMFSQPSYLRQIKPLSTSTALKGWASSSLAPFWNSSFSRIGSTSVDWVWTWDDGVWTWDDGSDSSQDEGSATHQDPDELLASVDFSVAGSRGVFRSSLSICVAAWWCSFSCSSRRRCSFSSWRSRRRTGQQRS